MVQPSYELVTVVGISEAKRGDKEIDDDKSAR